MGKKYISHTPRNENENEKAQAKHYEKEND
jgi:hypothetical protein